ncbi:acetyltransferase [Paenibacillus sp. DYY-L-2]|uniref:acetyltransferase n=1 Tax=Paenibacillus sp. DYY-L-2 TaxID=3447013 RepID=UPI003F50A284
MTNAIFPFEEHHHDTLVDIWHRAVVHTHSFLSEEDLQFYHNLVRNGALREVELWIEVNEKEQPIGFIGLNGTKIEMLFVDPVHHGQGVGRRLIQHAERLKGARLQVDVNEQNEGAYAFYQRLGFVQTGRSELDDSGRPYPLIHLSKE